MGKQDKDQDERKNELEERQEGSKQINDETNSQSFLDAESQVSTGELGDSPSDKPLMPIEMEEKIEERVLTAIEQAIKAQKNDPEVINEIITEKRNAELSIAEAAQAFHAVLLNDVAEDLKNRQQNVNQFKDNAKAIEILERDQKKINEIQSYIEKFQQNVGKGLSYERDKKTDEAQYNELLMTSSRPSRQDEISIPHQWVQKATEKVEVHSLEQLEARSKQIDLMHKTWKGLSQVRNDDDRSIWYTTMSDNLASGVMTGINTGRQGMAFAWALLTYAVADVLYEGLLKGAGKGLVKGAGTGYSGANKGIKYAANTLYKLTKDANKELAKTVNTNIAEYREIIQAEHPSEEGFNITQFMNNNIYALPIRKQAEKIYNTINTNYQEREENLPEATLKLSRAMNGYSLATTGAAALGGLAGTVVGAICNTIWEGVKNPALAVWDIKDKVQNHYNDIKPAEGTSWNKPYSQVQEEQQNKQIAKTMGKYAKKTNKAKFTEMVKDRKAEAKKGKGSDVHSI